MRFLRRLVAGEHPTDTAPAFEFEWREISVEADDGEELAGRGYALRDREGLAIPWDSPGLDDAGVWIINVAGTSHRRDVLQEPGCEPGQPVMMRLDPSNPYDSNAVEMHTSAGHVGFVPRERSADVAHRLRREQLEARVMWEWRKPSGERCALRVVVGSAGALPPFLPPR